ncbi:MAG: UDP-N-acetylmuramate--L-alanine ligase [Omnitrophica WOR_2 bacterium RBG_13_44_8b]|nr:MAG: UDP-N-acetylmuramate--L-alanine ligase [Omnitrophica WOR_2 bacterium RBG_13_44_8b]
MDKNHYHLVGIGGIGMSCIAKLLLNRGVKVSGSDLKESRITQELKGLGAQVFIGHSANNLQDADVVVYSSAIKETNPEIIESKKNGLPILKRAQALAELMKEKIVITVSGSHGKTTTTSLVSYLLLEAGLFPSVAIGGILRNIDTNACFGNGNFFVAEADESDGSFLYYRPKYSIITNIDREHLDYYKEFENELNAFREFLNNTEDDGCVFCCSDDENLKNIIAGYKNRHLLFGLKQGADIWPQNIKMDGLSSSFDCFYKGRLLDNFQLALGGEHNVSNSLSVIALALELGIDLKFVKKAFCEYKGAKRRLEVKFSERGLKVIDDYAHHPTEIKATLAAARNLNPGRLIAIFQPHRYTRTKLLLNEFARSFSLADYIVVSDIYPASEQPIEGLDAKILVELIKKQAPGKEVLYLAKEDIVPHVLKILKPTDLLITLGAGDIVKISDELVEKLKGQG